MNELNYGVIGSGDEDERAFNRGNIERKKLDVGSTIEALRDLEVRLRRFEYALHHSYKIIEDLKAKFTAEVSSERKQTIQGHIDQIEAHLARNEPLLADMRETLETERKKLDAMEREILEHIDPRGETAQ